MSQIHFRYKNLRISTGWERILGGYFFLLIEDSRFEDAYDAVVFDNLFLGDPDYRMSLEAVEATLKKFDIPFPDNIKATLKYHGDNNIGNYVTEFENCSRCFMIYERDIETCGCDL